jgi:hypothetical protein
MSCMALAAVFSSPPVHYSFPTHTHVPKMHEPFFHFGVILSSELQISTFVFHGFHVSCVVPSILAPQNYAGFVLISTLGQLQIQNMCTDFTPNHIVKSAHLSKET